MDMKFVAAESIIQKFWYKEIALLWDLNEFLEKSKNLYLDQYSMINLSHVVQV